MQRILCAIALVAMGINIGLHHLCERLPSIKSAPHALMPAPWVRLASGAYATWMADVAWLRAVEHHGNARMQAAGHPRLLPLLQRVVTLDPQHAYAYQFIGNAIDYAGPAYEPAMALLDQGMQRCPQAWRIAFAAGFHAYYEAHDYARAAALLARAAHAPEAPPQTAALATRLAAEAGLPHIGLQLLDTLLAQTDDPERQATLHERRRQLHLEVQLQDLQALVQTHAPAHADAPLSWETLLTVGAIQAIPHDPWGAPFVLQDGEVISIHDSQRLRLAPDAKGRARASR